MSNVVTVKNEQNMDMFQIMEKAYKFSEIIAKSDIIPKHYQGKPSNCFIAVQSAFRMNLDPMLVMQNTFVVNSNLGMRAQFALALGNNSNLFEDNISFETVNRGLKKFTKTGFSEPLKEQYLDIEVTAHAVFKKTKKPIKFTAIMQMAVDEDWIKNPKYKSMAELMLTYRSATFLLRTHCPEVLMGMQTVEELEDVAAASGKLKDVEMVETSTSNTSKTEELLKIIQAKEEPKPDPISTEPKMKEEQTLLSLPSLAEQISILIKEKKVPEEDYSLWLNKAQVKSFADMKEEDIKKYIMYIHKNYPKEGRE